MYVTNGENKLKKVIS